MMSHKQAFDDDYPNESGPLAVAQSRQWLEALPGDVFDRLTRLAAGALNAPLAAIAFMESDRIWLKCLFGGDVDRTPHLNMPLAHLVNERASLIATDLAHDPRFADQWPVSDERPMRAFLGVPLFAGDRQVIGALCVMDRMARDFGETHLAVLNDYAALVQAWMHERESERRAMSILNHVPALIGYWNRDLRCVFANERHRELFGLAPQQIIGTHLQDLMGEKVFARLQPHLRLVLEGKPQRFERTHRKPDGSSVRVEVHYIPDRPPGMLTRGFYVHSADVTALRAAYHALEAENVRLSNDSSTDFLTGLANRRVFSERSEAAWKRYKKIGEVCALILVDLDDFKIVNDVHGHAAGDDVLRAVGSLLQNQLRGQRDIAARLGGEEFAVLCFGEMDEELVTQVAERLRRRLSRESIDSGKYPFEVTASFGLALSNASDFGWKDIYARADAALYQAKAAGKNQVKFGAPSEIRVRHRTKLAARSKILRSVPSD
jgi:diguanylate cyclase (GGDEF)-like protein/PAS domain S-box-containing protein